MYVSSVLLFLPQPNKARRPSMRPLQHRHARRRKSRNRPRRTPITIPAIAPPDKPLLSGWAEILLPSEATGVWKASVVVAAAVLVTVATVFDVGRIKAELLDFAPHCPGLIHIWLESQHSQEPQDS